MTRLAVAKTSNRTALSFLLIPPGIAGLILLFGFESSTKQVGTIDCISGRSETNKVKKASSLANYFARTSKVNQVVDNMTKVEGNRNKIGIYFDQKEGKVNRIVVVENQLVMSNPFKKKLKEVKDKLCHDYTGVSFNSVKPHEVTIGGRG